MTEATIYAARGAASATGRPVVIGRPVEFAPKEFLTFRLGAQEYGIDALRVQEIRGCGELAEFQDAPKFIPGAIDLRGAVVPIADLRCWFGLERAADGMFAVAIVLNLGGRVFGVKVDSVSDVIRLARLQFRPAPESGSGPQAQYLFGIGIDEGRKLILLDIEKLMLGEGVGSLEIDVQ